MDMLPKLILSAVALLMTAAALLWAVWHDGYDAGSDAVMTEWQAERADALIATRQREVDLESTVSRLREEHHETVNRIAAERDAVVRELRRRPERPAGHMPATEIAGAQPGAACSADRLYRDDGEFLAGLARSADEAVAGLNECRAAYAAAQGVNN